MAMSSRRVQRYLHHAPAVRADELLDLSRVALLPHLPRQDRLDQIARWQNRNDPASHNTGGRPRVRAEHVDAFLRNLPGFRHG